MTDLATLAAHLDTLLGTDNFPDYPGALNGVQLANRSPIRRVAASVDVSRRVIEAAAREHANLLVVHHGMFWGGVQRLTGAAYERLRLLIAHDIAVYASHLPLDAHPTVGNNVLLAKEFGLNPAAGFARFKTIDVGVRGECDVETAELIRRVDVFVRRHGGTVRGTPMPTGHRTRRWGICTGAGASPETIEEAQALELDTLIVGEGPHHTAVAADDVGLVVVYAGHYATETLGVQALAANLTATFAIPSFFIPAPTGL
jgi:dinuclear metal center YbgI/SA1388 family protein